MWSQSLNLFRYFMWYTASVLWPLCKVLNLTVCYSNCAPRYTLFIFNNDKQIFQLGFMLRVVSSGNLWTLYFWWFFFLQFRLTTLNTSFLNKFITTRPWQKKPVLPFPCWLIYNVYEMTWPGIEPVSSKLKADILAPNKWGGLKQHFYPEVLGIIDTAKLPCNPAKIKSSKYGLMYRIQIYSRQWSVRI